MRKRASRSKSRVLLGVTNATRQHLRLAFFRNVAKATLSALRTSEAEVGIRFVTPREIADLSGTYRNKSKPTTILSFSYQEPPIRSVVRGDIVLCPAIAQKEARARKIKTEKHLAVLLIHGIVHLAGYTHDTDRQAREMERLEKKIARQLRTI